MIDRLESTSSNTKATKKVSTKKSVHDDHSDGSLRSINRVVRRDNHHDNNITNGNTGGFAYRHKSPHQEIYIRDNHSNVTRFELDRDEILNGGRRTASGTTVSYLFFFF